MLFQGEVYYGDILESSQIVCAAEMSPHSAKFSWSFKVGGEENKLSLLKASTYVEILLAIHLIFHTVVMSL